MDKEKKGLHLKRATKLKIIFAGLLTTVAAMFATIYFADNQSYNLSWIINVTVEDGATDPAYSSGGFDIKKAFLAILLGVLLAAVIVDIVSYGALANLVH